MLHTAYKWQQRSTTPARAASALTTRALDGLPAPVSRLPGVRRLRAACQIAAAARPTHVRPAWDIDSAHVAGRAVAVDVRPAVSTPFTTTLLHFAKRTQAVQPRVLLVGPMRSRRDAAYSGVAHLAAFMSMNSRRHLTAHAQLYRGLIAPS